MRYKVNDEVLIKARIKDMSYVDMMYVCELVTNPDVCIRFKSPTECIVADKTYADGLKDAWELAKKIYHAPCEGGLENSEIEEIFDCKFASVTHKYTAAEALAKIEAYERTKEIKVGDVIKYDGTFGVVARVGSCTVNALFEDGITIEMFISECKKTGKHIDIESLLRQIGE